MDAQLRAGVAVYNAGHYHAAHDAWEQRWLALDDGDDERFLHGLIQFTAAIYHARNRNWSGATGLAESGGEYLADLPADYRGVNVETVRESLTALERDPERVERAPAPALTYEGNSLALADLDFDASAVAAAVLAEDLGYDEGVIERAVEYARADLDSGDEGSQFVTFVLDFVRDPDSRPIVAQRLSEHVDRREHREADVDGLFEER
ncbi:hypothetical protein C475_06895 [Halosimplex carlsbadense 2-9-1]|uniref:DUF309 domain-containing protein n=1 Tax=Halosimplex carlsbadense 2-9-1 TaxID=797114 RepID=M0CYX6_9EURY|nr:DUF309 domain-containing protein [Halosimplex carlsbadense]ELZ27627.1 hypothetical protein C475_06895 [Halosimplex carlsbadense 2-9-1]